MHAPALCNRLVFLGDHFEGLAPMARHIAYRPTENGGPMAARGISSPLESQERETRLATD